MIKTKSNSFNIQILEKCYQRNGVGGEGFYVIRFTLDEYDKPLIATFAIDYDKNNNPILDYERCRVIDPTDLTISWRGDRIGAVFASEIVDDSFFS